MTGAPTLYEHYTGGGIQTGLSASQPHFTLNSRNITLYSGALHYFRVPPEYWRDRLRKMRAAGLNAVETYIPWNLHQPAPGTVDFGDGSSDYTHLLDVASFLRIAQEEDLLAIVRPGPYICAEWEFGGLPSWLLRYPTMKVRTNDKQFIDLVSGYFKMLLAILSTLQFTKGGPIIAFQIENEYGNTQNGIEPVDTAYLATLKDLLESNGIVELLFTSDTPSNGFSGTLPGVLATANFQEEPIVELTLLKDHQPNKPLMVMEYWTGWFDHWTERHHTRTADAFALVLKESLGFGASVNMYMFHGGTNWGLLNGANIKGLSTDNSAFQPDTTSYDYDAPLSEAGDYTDKFFKVKELIEQHNKIKTKIPTLPTLANRTAYQTVKIIGKLTTNDLISQSEHLLNSEKLLPMELLDINNKAGQSYGYVVYRKENLTISSNSILKIEGHVCDTVIVLINGELKSKILAKQEDLNGFGFWRLKDSTLNLGEEEYHNATLDLVVENWGRSNYGKLSQFNQHKGLWQGDVLINEKILKEWKIIPIEFRTKWNNNLKDWKEVDGTTKGPVLYKTELMINEEVKDTYIDLRDWKKGIVIVNGFVLARYCRLGPQQTVYLPAPLLKKGSNIILIYEHFTPSTDLKFVTDPVFEEVTI